MYTKYVGIFYAHIFTYLPTYVSIYLFLFIYSKIQSICHMVILYHAMCQNFLCPSVIMKMLKFDDVNFYSLYII
jgi:hypothetical protein